MSILETIGGLLGDAATKLHISVLNGNDTSHSPKNTKKLKIVEKDKTKTVDKSRTKNVDKSVHTHTSTHNHYYVLQVPNQLQPDNLPAEVAPLVKAYQEKQITYVTAEQQKEVSAVLAFEQDPHIKSLLTFFKDKLNSHDYNLLRTGLYLKYLRTNNTEEARKQWKRILLNNSKRDRRVINLAGADYFNTYFRPLYKELAKGDDASARFKKQFDDIIDDMHFVVFVGAEMSVGEVVSEVLEKATKNIRYGVKDEIIYIHAAGSGVQTVEDAVVELRRTFSNIVKKRTTKSHKMLIKASVYYRENTLDK